jgi:hypothetical protein
MRKSVDPIYTTACPQLTSSPSNTDHENHNNDTEVFPQNQGEMVLSDSDTEYEQEGRKGVGQDAPTFGDEVDDHHGPSDGHRINRKPHQHAEQRLGDSQAEPVAVGSFCAMSAALTIIRSST